MPGVKSKQIEKIYNEPWNELITKLYSKNGLSVEEIAIKIKKDSKISVSPRWIHYTIKALGISRTKSMARKLGIQKGRIDYNHLRKPIKSKESRKGISLKVRYTVFKRDKFKCSICGRGPKETILTIDHRVPIVRGGTSGLNNLRTLCRECNHGKMIAEHEK